MAVRDVKITTVVTLDPFDIAEDMGIDDMISLIVGLDEAMQDWAFTLRLCDYFDEQRRIHTQELEREAENDRKARCL